MHNDVAVLARNREGSLAFEIEVLLTTDPEAAGEPMQGNRDGALRIAAAERIIGEHCLSPYERVLDGDARRVGSDLDFCELHGATRDVTLGRDDRKQGLSVEGDLVIGKEGIVALAG
jgi:hypothetical protein